ncbi:MFS transporter [Bacteroidia bacterium]|nr:MFS transporter [Bacteroidia bacterium]
MVDINQKLRRSLRESKTARWTALALVSFTMLCGYYLADVMSPLKTLLELPPSQGGLGWDSSAYGFFTSAYGWINVFLLMLIVGGMILDRMGMRFTGTMAATVMIIGAGVKYWAITHDFGGVVYSFFGTPAGAQLVWASVGYAIFGFGVEVAGITVSKVVVHWFKGKEIALAMGLQVAVARVGMGIAIAFAPMIAFIQPFTISRPVLLGLILMCIGLLTYLVFCVMDTRLEKQLHETEPEAEEPFRFRDILSIMRVRGFWLVALLCVLFYSAVFPFMKYAADLMVNKFNVPDKWMGLIPAILPVGTMLMTPFFGNLYDRRGRGADIMIVGAAMIVAIHAAFAIPSLSWWPVALVLMALLGVSFSLVPSAMWPSVPKIIPENKLGTAYSLIFWIQNWGLMGVPFLVGKVLDRYCVVQAGTKEIISDTGQVLEPAGRTLYDYTLPMLIFALFGVAAVIVALMLRREDARKGFGLQQPNIKKG